MFAYFSPSGTKETQIKHGEGSFNLMKANVQDIEFCDFKNPWTFNYLFTRDDNVLFHWLRNHGLLAEIVVCSNRLSANLQYREKAAYNRVFRCRKGHKITKLKNSFFEGSSYNIRDNVIFMKYYIEGHTLNNAH